MDYLREGIHLRGFAQIDPLVAYKNEGFAMFEELMHSIWEEFSKLVFHAEIEVQPGEAEGAFAANGETDPSSLDYSGGTLEAQPSALEQVAAGAVPETTAAAAAAAGPAGNGASEPVETVIKDDHEKIGRNDPCWCGSGKKYKKCHGA
jgi:preprotein translocase subunit SecA